MPEVSTTVLSTTAFSTTGLSTTGLSTTGPEAETAALASDELLVEEVSIDGMCGVY